MKHQNSDEPQKAPGGKIGRVIKTVAGTIGVLMVTFVILLFAIARTAPGRYTESGDVVQSFAVVETESGTYWGPLKNLLFTGKGEFQYLSGGTYQGEFVNSQRSGEGTFTWENGDSYTGAWEADAMTNGTYTFADGSFYTGDFRNGVASDGVFTLGDTAAEHGYQSFCETFVSGKLANLKFQLEDGTTYDGELTGKATITYASGNTYFGDVQLGARNGEGTFTWFAGKEITAYYVGHWADGQMSGTGIYHYSGTEYPYIQGTFVDNRPDGIATYYKEAGNTFSTSWSGGICSSVTEQ